MESHLLLESTAVEARAAALSRAGHAAEARAVLTQFSVHAGQGLLGRWLALWQRLFVGYKDGFVNVPREPATPRDLSMIVAQEVGYPAKWYARVAADNGGCLARERSPGERCTPELLFMQAEIAILNARGAAGGGGAPVPLTAPAAPAVAAVAAVPRAAEAVEAAQEARGAPTTRVAQPRSASDGGLTRGGGRRRRRSRRRCRASMSRG